jgi:hypothetical protein
MPVLARMGLIFITAGQRPAKYTAIYFCLKGRILMFCSCLSGSVVGDISVCRSATRGYENPSFQDNEPANDERFLLSRVLANLKGKAIQLLSIISGSLHSVRDDEIQLLRHLLFCYTSRGLVLCINRV